MAAMAKAAHWIAMPVFTQGFVEILFARRYSTNDRNVVRIIKFTAVFFADMTPRKPSTGWWVPPIARASSSVTTIERGVAHTMKPIARISSIGGTYLR